MNRAARTVVVTGGGGGIGRAVVEALRARGDRAWAVSRSLPDDRSARTARADAALESALQSAFTLATAVDGAPDALVLCHGGGTFAPLVELDVDAFAADLHAHAIGTLVGLRVASQRFVDGGDVIVIGSIAATRVLPGSAGYGAAKAAQRMLALAAMEECRAGGLRVTLVHPGAVDTAIWDGRNERFDRTRMMRPADVASAVLQALDTPPGAHLVEVTITPRSGVLEPED